jgi:hypothetical protein
VIRILLLTISVTLLSSELFAKDFDTNQVNVIIKNKDYGIELRQHTNSERHHIQLERYINKWKFAYRYDKNNNKIEHRPRIDYKLYDNGKFFIKPRIEYRFYEDNRSNYGRLRSSFGLKLGNAYAEITPMLHFGGNKKDDLSIDEYQSKLGYVFKVLPNTKLNTFIQHNANKHFDKTNMLFGTKLIITF